MTSRLSCCSVLLPLTLYAVQAGAEESPPSASATVLAAADTPTTDANSNKIEQVVVTSQRRSQNVQDVPVSISVVGRDQLKAQGITDYDDLSRAVPGVSFNAVSAAEGETTVTIRGVSSTAGSATVSMYLDDVSITTKNFWDHASQPRFGDLQSLEVLRGPQGTLWGDSSEGGTIRFIPVEPNMNNFSGEVTGDLSETKHGSMNDAASVMLNVPVNPGIFAFRANLSSSWDSGWIDNFTQDGALAASGVNSNNATTLHVVGKITPNNDLTIKPAFFRQIANSHDDSAFYLNNPNANSGGVGSTFVPGLFNQDKQVREFGQDLMTLGSLSVNNDFHSFEFTSVTGVFHRTDNRQQDGTFFNSTLFSQLFLDPNSAFSANTAQNDSLIGNLPSPVQMKTDYRQVSQEFRISSPEGSKSPLKWVTGLFFESQTIHNTDFQRIPGINAAFQGIYGFSMDSPQSVAAGLGIPGVTLFPNDIDEADDRTYKERQIAAFGQIDYDLSADWHAGLGGRFVKASEDFVSTENGFYQIGNLGFSQTGNPGPSFTQSQSFTKFTPKATVSHDFDANNQLYASIGEGFRLGGPTGPIPAGSCTATGDFAQNGITTQPTSFKSDSLWTYELGSKNLLADNTISLNTAVFYTKWKNVQQSVWLTGCGFGFIENVGDAGIFGGEIEASAKVTKGLRLSLSLSRESATITNTLNPLAAPVGAHLVDVPDLTATLGAAYTTNLSDGSKIVTRANYAWIGHSYGSLQPLLPTSGLPNPGYNNNGYGVLNLSASWVDKMYDVTVYAKNALNNQTIIQSPSINTVTEAYTVRPLTVGLTSAYRF